MFKGPKINNAPRIGFYHSDGTGRDGYIYSTNGGFSKENRICLTDTGPSCMRQSFEKRYDISLRKGVHRYFNQGDGRDMYISGLNGEEMSKCGINLSLPAIVRNDAVQLSPKAKPIGFRSEKEKAFYDNLRGVERRLINRVFYGKEEGIEERRLSPKVNFAQKRLKASCHYLTKLPSNPSNGLKISADSIPSITERCRSIMDYTQRRARE